MGRACVALGVAAVAACLLGCGGGEDADQGASPTDAASPKTTWQAMWSAAKAGDRDAMLACFNKDSQAKLREMDRLLAERARDLPREAKGATTAGEMMALARSARMEVGEEEIDGERATLKVRIDGRSDLIYLSKEAGTWKIDMGLPEADQMKSRLDEALSPKREAEAPEQPK